MKSLIAFAILFIMTIPTVLAQDKNRLLLDETFGTDLKTKYKVETANEKIYRVLQTIVGQVDFHELKTRKGMKYTMWYYKEEKEHVLAVLKQWDEEQTKKRKQQ